MSQRDPHQRDDEVSDRAEVEDERRPYEPPRVESGYTFEGVVLGGSSPTECV